MSSMIKSLFKKKDAKKKLTAVLVDLRNKETFTIVDFETHFEVFNHLEELGVKCIKFYNYDPKEGRIIITFPIKLSPETE